MERIFHRRSAELAICQDMLIRNVGADPIARFRLAVPYPLIDVEQLVRMRDQRRAMQKLRKLRDTQLSRLQLRTEELTMPAHDSNWLYDLLSHVKLDRYDPDSGILRLTRSGQEVGDSQLTGYIKQGWTARLSINDQWLWLAHSCNGVSFFDLQSPDDREHILPNQNMWIRVFLKVPRSRENRKLAVERVFARSLEYRHIFKSPFRIHNELTEKFRRFNPENLEYSPSIQPLLRVTTPRLAELIDVQVTEVRDWRTFVHREYGLAFERIDERGEPICRPVGSGNFSFPPVADPKKAKRFPVPFFAHALFRHRPRSDTAEEFFFGQDHHSDEDDDRESDHLIDITTRSGNVWYNYLVWAAFLLGIINLIRSFLAH